MKEIRLNAFSTFSASYFHRVNGLIEAGGKAVWDKKSQTSAVGIEVGAKYSLDRDAYLKVQSFRRDMCVN
jgi:voltage-dependent anion channel protein 2